MDTQQKTGPDSAIRSPASYRAALYVRLSREDAREGPSQSIDNQISLLMEFSRKNHLPIYDTYIDDGISGTTFDRPGFSRMLRDIEAHKVNLVITKDLSRLGRDYILTGHCMERYFPEHQVRYISLLDGIDTGVESSANEVMPFRALMNDMYARDISRKITSVKRSRQKQGLFIGTRPPYGYKAHPEGKSRFVIDENAAPIVRRIFSMALEGTSCRKIAGTLNEEGIPSPSVYAGIKVGRKGPYAGLWSGERISAMLQNEVYIGNMVQGRSVSVSYKSRKQIKLPRDQWTVIPDTHEPIVDPETFREVGARICSRRHTGCQSHDYLLKGLIYCHECGHLLGVINCTRADHKEHLYFICRTYQRFSRSGACTCHYSNAGEITQAVMEKVMNICRNYLDRELLVSAVCRILEQRDTPLKKEIRHLERSLHSLSANLDQIYTDKLSGVLAPETFRRICTELKPQYHEMSRKLQSLQTAQTLSDTQKAEPQRLAEKFLHEAHCSRKLLTSLVERIELSEDRELYIRFRFKSLNFPDL